MAAGGMPKLPLGQSESNDSSEQDGNNCQNTADTQRDSNMVPTISGSNFGTSGPVDHLLHAIGVIFGNTVSSGNTKIKDAQNSQLSMIPADSEQQNINNDYEASISTSSYICKVCKMKFSKKTDLKQHSFTHTGHLRFKCDFDGCGWSFHTKYKLERHLMVHSMNKKYICPEESCKKSFTEACGLKVHLQSHSKPCKCPVEGCGAEFATSQKLESHKKKSHEIKSFRCREDNCKAVLESVEMLNEHILSHGKHKCSECSKTFTKKSLLDIHTRSHTNERPFKCKKENCGASFVSSYKLNRHMKNHSDVRPFSCTIDGCGAAFKRQDHLRKHISQHDGKKPYSCPIEGCSSKFTVGGSLKHHLHTHTKLFRYSCPIKDCTKEYFSKPTLTCHIKRHQAQIQQAQELEENRNDNCSSDKDTGCVVLVGMRPDSSISAPQTRSTQLATDSTNTRTHEDILAPEKFNASISMDSNDCNSDTKVDSHYAVVALGEAECFQYINETTNYKLTMPTSVVSAMKQNAKKHETISSSSLLSENNQRKNKQDKNQVVLSQNSADSNISSSEQFTSTGSEAAKLDFANSIFGGESVTVPLSMTRFLPQELQTTEYLSNEYRNDHAYNRTLLSGDPNPFVTSDNRNMDPAIEKSLSVSDHFGSVNASDSMVEMKSFLIENGMSSFLANDDIGRMETCATEDLTINRKFDRSVSHDVAMMIEDCISERRASTLSSGFNHYSSHDSYVSSLMESSHTVSEHLLNISNNPTMVDHMYSQLGPEDDLEIVTEDHAYEESTVNIQDIR
eukprot:gene16732-18425_t